MGRGKELMGRVYLTGMQHHPLFAILLVEVGNGEFHEFTQIHEHRLLDLAQPHLHVSPGVQTLGSRRRVR